MKKLSFLFAAMLVLAMASTAFAAQASYKVNGVNYYSSTTPSGVRVDTNDSSIEKLNANNQFKADGKTNYPYEIYLPNENNPENYRIHSNYTKNTDACAACHATHTAVGNSLLQWYTVYDTCMACHDGTVTTTYDVQGGVIGATTKATFGGHFGTGKEGSLSSHNVTGAVEIAAAPGGSVVGEDVTVGKDTKQRWTVEFGCQSCHTPHGQGGNARILHPDANYTASDNSAGKTYYVSSVNGYVYDKDPSAVDAKKVYILKGYPYGAEVQVNGTKEAAATIDNTEGVSKIVYAVGNSETITIAKGVAALQVKMAITDYLQGTETVEHKDGMNYFCGACHTDYNTAAFTASGSAEMETGVYSKAHRHQVGFVAKQNIAGANMVKEDGKMECLTCHVAHGTSTDYWTRTVGSESTTDGRLTAAYITNDADLAELAGSSALKRLPNMGTCEACHSKGAGNEGYSANTAQADVTPDTAGQTDAMFTPSVRTNFDNFVGSTTCKNCHEDHYDGWATTTHKGMVTDASVAANWLADATALTAGESTLVAAYNAAFGAGSISNVAEFKAEVDYLLGSKWKQRFLFKTADKGIVVLDGPGVQYYPGNNSWNAYGASTTAGGKLWSGDCILCHTTGWNGNDGYNAGDVNAVQFKEGGISCEACHGAGANHAKAPSAKNIIGVSGMTMADQTAVCGKCHNRGFDEDTTVYHKADRAAFNGGREDYYTAWDLGTENTFNGLNSTFMLVYGTAAGKAQYAPWNNFAKTDANVYADETAKGHHQQYNEFLQSGHYKSNIMSCTTCHDPHKKNADGAQMKAASVAVCASCHDAALNLDTYMPYTVKTASGNVFNNKTETFGAVGNGGGDLRSHAFKTNYDYKQSGPATDWINAPSLK